MKRSARPPAAARRDDGIPASVRRAIVAHARREVPRECCGFLVGREGSVIAAVPMANVADGQTRYRIDDRAHIELRRTLRRFAPPLEIVGVYHSHPNGPATPSPTDVREAHYPEWLHVILSLVNARARVGVFRLSPGRVEVVTSAVNGSPTRRARTSRARRTIE